MTEQEIRDLIDNLPNISELNSINIKYPTDITSYSDYIIKTNYIPESENDFENDCNMWLLQIKAFIVDAMVNEEDISLLTNFIDELSKLKKIIS